MEPNAPSLSHFPPAVRLVGNLIVHGGARIACQIRGKIEVRDRLEIDKQAVIDGEVRSGSIKIEPGATVKASLAIGKEALQAPPPPLRRLFSLGFFKQG